MCIHFPDLPAEVVRCTTCLHGVEYPKQPKPDNWWLEASSGATVDPGEALLEGIMAGVICPRCMTSRVPIGCACDRNRLGSDDLAAACDFLERAPDKATMLGVIFTETEAGHVATSVTKRALRRMVLSEDDAADIRLGIREEFHIPAKWFPPRVTEPTPLPI